MSRKGKKPERLFTIRAYCADCQSLLQESVPLNRKELMVNWDDAVVKAINIPCEKCEHRFPNTRINLKICDKRTGTEYEPAKFLPEPGYSVDDLMKGKQ